MTVTSPDVSILVVAGDLSSFGPVALWEALGPFLENQELLILDLQEAHSMSAATLEVLAVWNAHRPPGPLEVLGVEQLTPTAFVRAALMRGNES